MLRVCVRARVRLMTPAQRRHLHAACDSTSTQSGMLRAFCCARVRGVSDSARNNQSCSVRCTFSCVHARATFSCVCVCACACVDSHAVGSSHRGPSPHGPQSGRFGFSIRLVRSGADGHVLLLLRRARAPSCDRRRLILSRGGPPRGPQHVAAARHGTGRSQAASAYSRCWFSVALPNMCWWICRPLRARGYAQGRGAHLP